MKIRILRRKLEPEREELHRLADILPINEVKELLKLSDKFWDKK